MLPNEAVRDIPFMKTPLDTNEQILKQGAANLQRGIETVGGKLYLTNQKLIFESHVINIQRGATIVPIDNVATVAKCWTKFLNLIPIMPNSLLVTTTQGQEYKFVISGRDAWASAIANAKAA